MSAHSAMMRLVTIFTLFGAMAVLSCGDEKSPMQPQPNPMGADSLVMLANSELEQVLFDELNSSPDRPNDIDFTGPHGLYSQALALDPSNPDAALGVAITGLLILTSDPEVNDAFDEWRDYLDQNTPFEQNSMAGGPFGVPLGFTAGGASVRLPFDVVPLMAASFARPSLILADPQLGRVQNILRDRVLPALQSAVTHLGNVADDPDYTFTVTPLMQGDAEAAPVELDQTDILAVRAGASLLSAACRVAVSWNIGMASYDSLSLHEAFLPGSDWMTLTTDGASQMSTARTDLVTAVNDVDRALIALLRETDNQDDDIIKIGPSDLDRADVDSILANLPFVLRSLDPEVGYTRVDDWDNDAATPDIALTINLGKLFTNPPADWKALLPAYSSSTQLCTQGYGPPGGFDVTRPITVTVPQSGSYTVFYSMSNYSYPGCRDNHGPFYYLSSPDFAREAVLQDGEEFFGALPPCLDESTIYAEWQGNLGTGVQIIQVAWRVTWFEAEACVHVPVITWDAQTFEEWIWPDPTFGGILPDLLSTPQMMQTFGIEARQWERQWVLDWTSKG